MDYVVDGYGRLLRPGDEVYVGGKGGTYLAFEEDRVFLMEQGALSGQIVVDVNGVEERLPTFAIGGQDVCYDVEIA